MESQGNIAAAQRLYSKVTKINPDFIYGWSNLGNTQVVLGDLPSADNNYSKAIRLCQESLDSSEAAFGVKRCSDLYVLLLNRGTVRLNSGMYAEALGDLERASALRERPDAIVAQNLARAREVNGYYNQADKDYALAISMTANEVSPFWLRAAIVKLQLGDVDGGFNLFKRVEIRFPEAPEVRAAYAVFLDAKGDTLAARRKFLEIPDRQRLKFSDTEYLNKVVSWPPAAINRILDIAALVGDAKTTSLV
uniref:Tetratricopeptide repeat protein n=1 Tax=Craspedostauros australis TaxID=1486917 RepID=A0A7R9ZLB8_9STRA